MEIAGGAKLATDGSSKKNRFLDSTWMLYQAVKVLLFGYLLVGASDYAPGNLPILNADGKPVNNPDGAAKRKKVRRSLQTVLQYLNILENAFIIASVNGGFGKNLIANFDLGGTSPYPRTKTSQCGCDVWRIALDEFRCNASLHASARC